MSMQRNHGSEAGFTLIELLIVTIVFGVVIAGALGFMTVQHNAFNKGADQLMTLQNLRYAYQTLEIDLSTLGSNVPAGQPAMVLAEDDVVAFTGDYTSNLANDISAVRGYSLKSTDPQDIVVTGALRAVSHVRCRGKGPKLAWEHTEQPAQASGRTTGREPGMCVG